ncbi:hypothetical protein [Streptococcus acidominimus]|uniref:Uncharacterized protein n=1 Tax=Streptococcus acidominimus TaxID=1326 RepID=A0A1Q8E977_STRAI|nr:hypothetical protein [Streptococcus acidominimus]OLF48333.1 hypothetical protein BU200_09860 [Streptococcus acidominimus]SUN08243.1 Uncharacterised protein [Streptococcus acidominimus]
MSKRSFYQISLYSLLLLVANWSLSFLPDGIYYYLIKTGLLALIFYLAGHRFLHLNMPLKVRVGLGEQLRVNWLNLLYLIFVCLPLLAFGFEEHQDYLPTALI